MLLVLAVAAPGLAQTAPADAAGARPAAAAPADAPAAVVDPSAPAGEYRLDPHHSQVVFSYDHMGMSTSRGMVRGVAGTVTLDPADPGASRVEAMFPLSALQTVTPELDEHLMGKDFFNGAAPATAVTFTSTDVQPTGEGTAQVTGDLTLNGVTRPLTLEVTLRRMGENPMTKKPAAGFEATGSLLRSDFNLGAFAPAVSDRVDLLISAEAVKD